MNVKFEQRIYSSVPDRVGNWSISRSVDLPVVSRTGDEVILADNGITESVVLATFTLTGSAHVTLAPCKTDSPDVLDSLATLVAEYGWEQSGGPWAA